MRNSEQTLNFRLFARFFTTVVISFLILLFFCSNALFAKPVDVKDAQKAVKGWIKLDSNPLGVNFGEQVLKTDVFANAYGEPIYYVVYLESGGFAIVSADDLVEPIVGFVSSGTFDPSDDNPLGALVSKDMPNRIAAVRAVQPAKGGMVIIQDMAEQEAFEKAKVTAQGKWNKLHGLADSAKAKGLSAFGQTGEDGILGTPSEPDLSDIRVSPLLQSKWDQADVNGAYCYNYYTPNHFYSGCVATAMAQLMRFHRYPTDGIGRNAFTIYVNGSSRMAYTRGGDGIGGPYYWSQMTLDPNADCNVTGIQLEAIGALCFDAGVAVNMQYASDVSGAYMWDAKRALLDTFLYGNAILGYNNYNNIGPGLNGMMNPNLDAGYPVLLGIHNSGGGAGHAIVADGYGYNS
ncbi:MAG: C10 family peptidase, partial [Planctomycetota bacterium]|nr:C10 family peptidase [Planctomycetota bacterium]